MQSNAGRKTRRGTTQAAFTLTELLVVLAIVAALAGILFPVLAGVRERGRRTVCQSNLKQIALAMQQYVQDNGGVYPPFPYTWSRAAYSYMKSAQVFRCPDHPAEFSPQVVLDSTNGSGPQPVDYTYDNARLTKFLPPYQPPYQSKNFQGAQESSLTTPSTIWLNEDGNWISSDGVNHYGRFVFKTSCGREFGGSTIHSDAGNYSYVDGHVKWLTPEEAGEVECLNGPLPAPFKD